MTVALVVAFFGLSLLFERHVERRVANELLLHLDQMISALSLRDGQLALEKQPNDPRFSQPLSGLYWQVESGGETLRSRSLWDVELKLPQLDPGEPISRSIDGPAGTSLLVIEREIVGGKRLANQTVLLAVAVIRNDIETAISAFRRDMLPYLALLAALFIAATAIQIYIGLRPLSALRARVADVRNGRATSIGDSFPSEIRPLTYEVDELIASRELQLKRAREHAADFAHGFKTPLQALAGDISRLRDRGEAALADDIQSLTVSMRRQVDRQMARARMAGRSVRRTDVGDAVRRVISVFERTPKGASLRWEINGHDDLQARIDPEDLTEALGNILDNAMRYARERVIVTLTREGASVMITITDDGPGIPPEKITLVLGRGGRLDESSEGAGLGLAIAQDVIAAAEGSLLLRNKNVGLSVLIRLAAFH